MWLMTSRDIRIPLAYLPMTHLDVFQLKVEAICMLEIFQESHFLPSCLFIHHLYFQQSISFHLLEW